MPSRDQLSPQFYDALKDALRPYPYDPERARSLLREVGWTPGGDGEMRFAADGRSFRTSIWSSLGLEREIAAYAGYWRQLGIEVAEYTIPAARTRDRQYRAEFPGWLTTGQDALDQMADGASGPQNGWRGNDTGYEDAAARRLVNAFRTSITDGDQVRAIKEVSDHYVAELPFIPVYFLAAYLAVRNGVLAFDDAAGGYTGRTRYGSFSRNAYLWDLQ
jgi:ABC-type transport system substrate-binding protein